MEYILSTRISGTTHYMKSTSIRSWDNKKLINHTRKVEEAKTFDTEQEAVDYLSKCITNGRIYLLETYQNA